MGKFDNVIIISDLDGTLLDDNGNISSYDLKAIEYFKSEGGKFSIATGRTVNRTYFLNDCLSLDFAGIFSNGATIANLCDKKVLWEKFMDESAREVIRDFHHKFPQNGIIVYSGNKDYFFNIDKFEKTGANLDGFNIYKENIDNINTPLNKIVIISFDDILDFLNEEYKKYLDKIYFSKSNKYLYEIIDKSINKGNAVDFIKNMYHFENSKIITIGDNLNDLEFIEKADIGICVLNDCKALIDKADLTVTKGNVLHKVIYELL